MPLRRLEPQSGPGDHGEDDRLGPPERRAELFGDLGIEFPAGKDVEINRLKQGQCVADHVAGLYELDGGYPLQVRQAAMVLPEQRLAVPRHLD
jgi:hypothetical protein